MSEIMSKYESVMVISMKLGEEGIQKLIEKFKALIEKNATLDTVDEWGKRRLAYMINKESEGYYVLFNFTSNADFPAELDRRYKITDGVLRTLIIKKDEE
ncbi:MAG: 30S ribosomal protein S6 [Acutalibacteraceae bacterium]|jgi:small subunit ribosomal protein S6|nr:30S ribosomal protein S6 [Acutalibacteraceae bacterium]MEE0264837.1 30S ribosomal protein S6 [Acutalibacteraceae bacterium]MEE1126152.1 30S ribosomal protein S6 [Acutalibacteraceae bacterium]